MLCVQLLPIPLVLTAVGCVSANDSAGSSRATGRAVAQALAPGFYRNRDHQTVFKVGADRTGCVVRNPQQMNAFGGFARVTIVDSSVSILGSIAGRPSYCAWPNGLYRISGGAEVYRVSNGVVCVDTVAVDGRRARSIPEAADLLPSGRIAACRRNARAR